MKMLIIIHCPPSSHNARLAWQCIQQALMQGINVDAFFDGDGVWHAHHPTVLDSGLINLHNAYNGLIETYPGLRLLICRAALTRRSKLDLQDGWQASGLTAMAAQLAQADRVLTFSI